MFAYHLHHSLHRLPHLHNILPQLLTPISQETQPISQPIFPIPFGKLVRPPRHKVDLLRDDVLHGPNISCHSRQSS